MTKMINMKKESSIFDTKIESLLWNLGSKYLEYETKNHMEHSMIRNFNMRSKL